MKTVSHYKDWFHIHQFPGELVLATEIYFIMLFGFEGLCQIKQSRGQGLSFKGQTYWIEEFDIDRRLDEARGLTHQFGRLKSSFEVKPDLYILEKFT